MTHTQFQAQLDRDFYTGFLFVAAVTLVFMLVALGVAWWQWRQVKPLVNAATDYVGAQTEATRVKTAHSNQEEALAKLAAQRLGVSAETVAEWLREGRMTVQSGPGQPAG